MPERIPVVLDRAARQLLANEAIGEAALRSLLGERSCQRPSLARRRSAWTDSPEDYFT